MENNQNAIVSEQHDKKMPIAEKKKELINPGGKVFPLFLIAFAMVFFIESLQIYQKDPSLSGSAIFPLFVSGLMLLLCVIDWIQKLTSESKIKGLSFKEKAKAVQEHLIPVRCLVFLLMSVAYYYMLYFGLGFIISSSIYLLASMCYLIRKNFWKNVMYTAICVAALYIIFKVIFKVFLP